MKNFLDNALRNIREFFKNLDKKQRIRFGVLAAVVIALAVTLTVVLNRKDYALLYTGLPQEEAGRVYATLREMGEDVKVEGTGSIFVPSDRVSELRMTLLGAGYETSGFDYSILAEATGFSVSDFEQQEYSVLQKQEMLRTTINRTDKIEDCLVLIVPAKVSDFVRALDEQDSSASVMLITKNGEMLTQSEANGIIRIVLNAVAGIKPENISIVDEALNVYFMDEDGEGDETANITTQRLLEESIKRELSSQIVNLLTPVFGAGKVRAEASVTLDFDSEVSEDIVFTEPVEGMGTGLMLSMADELEIARANGAAEGVPGTDANGMGTQEDIDGTITYPYGDLEEGETYRRVFEEANYEINKKVTQLEKAKGTVKAMSIGVMVDSVAVPEDYTEQVRELVASAIGTSVDYVTVARLPFQDGALNPVVDGIQSYIDAMDQYRTQELLRTGIICATVLILVIFILMLIRSMLKKKEEPVMEAAGAGGGINYLVGGDEQYESGMYGSGEDVASVGEAKEDEEIVTVGAPPPETVVQLEKMIKSNPEAVASILRGWLTDEQ